MMRVFEVFFLCVAAAGLASPASADIISYWNFDGNANDTVGPNNGTVQGSSHSYVSGKFGQAISLGNGTANWVNVLDHPSLDVGSALTATMWVDVSSDMTSTGLLTRDDDNTYKYLIYVNSAGQLQAYRRNGGTAAATSGIANTWRNSSEMALVTMTYDAAGGTDNLRIYLNGALGGTNTLTGSIDDGNSGLDIGRWNLGVNGTRIIDDVALFDHAWTDGEVMAAYNLANHVDLTYNTLDAYQLFAEHRDPDDGVQVDDLVWNFVDGLSTGTPGSLIQDGNGDFLLYLSATDGLTTAIQAQVVPEPSTLALFGVAIIGFALVSRRRSARGRS